MAYNKKKALAYLDMALNACVDEAGLDYPAIMDHVCNHAMNNYRGELLAQSSNASHDAAYRAVYGKQRRARAAKAGGQ